MFLFQSTEEPSKLRRLVTLAALCILHMFNFADRFAPSAMLPHIQKYYELNDKSGGLIFVTFIGSLTLASLLFGFLGDRFPRIWIILVAQTIACLSSFASTFATEKFFWLFLLCRGLSGVGQASYVINTPTVIGDMFSGNGRSRALMFFYFAIPVGSSTSFSGLGMALASLMLSLTGEWKWAVRLPPILCFLSILFAGSVAYEPERGANEMKQGEMIQKSGSFFHETLALLRNVTYMVLVVANSVTTLGVMSCSWWIPSVVKYAKMSEATSSSSLSMAIDETKLVDLYLGVGFCLGGLVGVTMGSMLSEQYPATAYGRISGLQN